MRVRITMTLNVDPEAWLRNYGVIVKPPRSIRYVAVRNDIKGYFEGYCQEQLERLGCEAKESHQLDT